VARKSTPTKPGARYKTIQAVPGLSPSAAELVLKRDIRFATQALRQNRSDEFSSRNFRNVQTNL
jgi:hypothetical protein